MKRVLSIVMFLVLLFMLAACGQTAEGEVGSAGSGAPSESEPEKPSTSSTPASSASSETPIPTPGTENPAGTTEGRILVAYFSWSGNTEEMASYIAEQTGGDLLEIQPETPYPTDYNDCGELALVERDHDERPAIANLPESIDGYETILIGYPKMEQGYICV